MKLFSSYRGCGCRAPRSTRNCTSNPNLNVYEQRGIFFSFSGNDRFCLVAEHSVGTERCKVLFTV